MLTSMTTKCHWLLTSIIQLSLNGNLANPPPPWCRTQKGKQSWWWLVSPKAAKIKCSRTFKANGLGITSRLCNEKKNGSCKILAKTGDCEVRITMFATYWMRSFNANTHEFSIFGTATSTASLAVIALSYRWIPCQNKTVFHQIGVLLFHQSI